VNTFPLSSEVPLIAFPLYHVIVGSGFPSTGQEIFSKLPLQVGIPLSTFSAEGATEKKKEHLELN